MNKSYSPEWSLEEKQKFVTGLNHPMCQKDGVVNWTALRKFIGTKSSQQVKEFARKFNDLENGTVYPEFSLKAAVDVWKELAQKATTPGDTIANVCIPQVLTVAAFEPTIDLPGENQPNYNNIYSYLSAVTRGADVPDLPPSDAAVVLELLEDLIKTLSKSETVIQREYMHERYAEVRHLLNVESESSSDHQRSSSTNPFAIPFGVLEFKSETFNNVSK